MRRGIKQKFNTTKTMQDLQAYYQSEFATFWAKSFPKKSCPPLPKKLEDLGMLEQLAMREQAPELFQNLFRSDYSAMPSDVATRLRNNQLWAGDEVVLEKYGWTAKAKEMRAQIEEGQRLAMEQKIQEMKERNEARDKARIEASKQPKNIDFYDPSAVAFRRQHNLSDDIGFGR
tara:strand:+ start:318 stop:839 length:522 start_codon:yes stop_codon:yes gene_type:complete